MTFGLADHVDALVAARLSVPSQHGPDLRTRFTRLLGLEGRAAVPVSARLVDVKDRGSCREEHISLDVGEGVQAPLSVLVPRGEPPFKAIVAFHGHEPGVDAITGNYPDEAAARDNLARENNYAQALAEAGYLVCAVEQRGLGRRLTDQVDGGPVPRSCRHLAFAYLSAGRTLIGERCWDAMCAISYLQTRPDVRPGDLGSTGHSAGGCTALWLAALDERVTVSVISGYFCSFRASILAMPHCECNYLPGILDLGDMGDLAALVAPRPLGIVHGREDPIFPVAGTEEQFETVHRTYQAASRGDACTLVVHAGGHVYCQAESLAWFRRWL